MYASMYYKIILVIEYLITHITSVTVLTTVYVLMLYKTLPLTECFITHRTSIWAVTAMYLLMWYQTPLFSECLITWRTGMQVLTSKVMLMCYQTALISECPNTQFTWIWKLTPIYTTGISAFSTVFMKWFVTLVKQKGQSVGCRLLELLCLQQCTHYIKMKCMRRTVLFTRVSRQQTFIWITTSSNKTEPVTFMLHLFHLCLFSF
jgi:hypothetical protein